ncbi:D-2-hydroxyacid dehydrogenase [Oceanobacillus sp. CAU 1775]
MIVFSAKISTKHREKLVKDFPNSKFVFCDRPEEATKYLADAEVFVTYGNDIDEGLVEAGEKLKWIACLSAGVDRFPFKAIKEKGIIVTNVRGIHKIQMAEYAISMLLQVYRNAKTIIENEKNTVWDNRIKVQEITGKTMVILGTGAIGGETARLAKAFRMKTIGVSRSGKEVEYFDEVHQTSELREVLPKADFVISVLPSTKATERLLTYEDFHVMNSSAVFLNMGRGSVLVEADLLRAIQEEKIAHAVLDVFDEEPLPKEHPFWKEENITITPHISGLSPAYVVRALDIFKQNLQAFEQNKADMINTVNLDEGY